MTTQPEDQKPAVDIEAGDKVPGAGLTCLGLDFWGEYFLRRGGHSLPQREPRGKDDE